jgi:PadR family transcriptional regulator AphA
MAPRMTARRAAAPVAHDVALTPVQYAILGLLREHAAHGYELQRSFSEGSDLAGVVHLEQASLYAGLKELANQQLIEGTETREGLRPPRTVYGLTADGRRVLDAWLRTPVERLRQVRLDFLLKVYFARQRSEASVRTLVDAQIATCHRYLADLEAHASELGPESFAYLVTESRKSAARSTLEWLREYRRRL